MRQTVKRILALLLTLCLLPVGALAAENVTWSKDVTLTAKVNKYADAVVGEGVRVTLKDSGDPDEPTGLWITGSLTVKAGGSIGGSGILILEKGASLTGLELYYRVGGEVRLLKGGIKTLWDSDVLKNEGDMGVFAYETASNQWIMERYTFEQDPFDKSYDAPLDTSWRDLSAATDAATRLKRLGLFEGSGTLPDGGTDFELGRAPSRLEALIMLLALTGSKAELNAGTWPHPFTDVPAWADKYVGYAYSKGITGGVSATKFGADDTASAQMYLTFTLRALGYSAAAGGDFAWDAPEELAARAGILTQEIALDAFLRADVALVSEAALCAEMKDGSGLLLDALIAAGVFTGADFNAAFPDSPVQRGEAQTGVAEYDREPVTLSTGARTFSFTIVNVDTQTNMTALYLSDGSYSGPDWQSTDKGWVKFDVKQNGLTTSFSCRSDVDFENVPDLKIRYTKNDGTNTAFFGCAVKNGGRYWMEETADQLMTEK